jgi:hypothetical protein
MSGWLSRRVRFVIARHLREQVLVENSCGVVARKLDALG